MLAPGQGSQTPGMLASWLELPGAADRISTWSQASGLDLATLGTTATAEEITDTAVTQPLVVAATLLAWEELTKRGLLAGRDFIAAGHSVGEIAAYAIAGVISSDDAVALAATRGAEMAKACATEPTGMSAVLGGDEAEVLSRLEALDLVPANRNAAGQIVAAGSLTALSKLAEDPPEKARVRALATAGAFHTHYMAAGHRRLRRRGRRRRDRRTDRHPAVQRRRPAGRLGRGRHEQAGRPADPAGALGPVHGDSPAIERDRDRRVPARRDTRRDRQTRTERGADEGRQNPRRPGRAIRALEV